jgi:hypothetical protein
MTTRLFLFSLLLSLSPYAQSEACFSDHIKQSIEINQRNSKIYAKLTKGASDNVFKQLIAGEKASLKIASSFDKKASSYHEKEIDLFCQEFVDMNSTQIELIKNESIKEEPLTLEYFSFFPTINKAIQTRNDREIRRITLEALKELNQSPKYHCFARHIIESIYRFAYYMPIRKKQSVKRGMKDPSKLMIKVMKLQLMALPFAHHIDKISAPIQKQGVAILCQELPNLINDIDMEELADLKNGNQYGKN